MKTYKVSVFRKTEFVTEIEAENVDVAMELAQLEAGQHSAIIEESVEAEVAFR